MNSKKSIDVKINSKNTIHEGKIFKLTNENITIDNHITVDLNIIRHTGASGIVN